MPADVRSQMHACHIGRAVLVQAAGTPEEIPWMLGLCDDYPLPAGVVGYVDLTSRNATGTLTGFARDPRFKGVRLNLPFASRQRSSIDTCLTQLGRLGLSCDILMSAIHLPIALDIIRAHPETTFVLDHFAGFRLRIGGGEVFSKAMQPLAALPNANVKISGFLTANDNIPLFTLAQTLGEYVVKSTKLLGANRLLYGSDWPVCTQVGEYRDTVKMLHQATHELSAQDASMIFSGTASRVYRL